MNKRLIWNFEINDETPLNIPEDRPLDAINVHWESRYFWSEGAIILLNGLGESFLELSRYEIKHRQDTYCLLPERDDNIKIRHNKTLYKPVIQRTSQAVAYDKKVALEEGHELLVQIQQHGQRIGVEKEALIYRFQTTPTLKFELARLCIGQAIYYSASVESRSKYLVESISQQILGRQRSSDYVRFLKELKN